METFHPSIQNVVTFLTDRLKPEAIILFGSRARGDHRPISDIDLSIKGEIDDALWAKVMLELNEYPCTLLPLDIVRYNDLDASYRENIGREGVVCYERHH